MNKKDLSLVTLIGAAVGLLIQPMVTTIGSSIPFIGASPAPATRGAIFLFFLVLAPIALFVAKLLGKFLPVIYQFAKFAAVGSLNSFVDFGLLNLFIVFTDNTSGAPYVIFKAVSFLVATTNSFFWNKFWTFGSGGTKAGDEAPKFYLVAIVGWVLNVGVASVVVNYLNPGVYGALWANFGALMGIAASFLWNFLGYKFVVFKKPSAQTS